MKACSCLLFRLDYMWFVVEAAVVREILELPALIRMPESPPYIAGVLNLRGRHVPVMDLLLRFGAKSQPRSVKDLLIVMEIDGHALGVIVNEIAELRDVGVREFQPLPDYGSEHFPPPAYLSGLVPVLQGMAMRLNLKNLLRLPPEVAEGLDAAAAGLHTPLAGSGSRVAEERVFLTRARNYAQVPEAQEPGARSHLAVFSLNQEYFAVDVTFVREFVDLGESAPVPCCPPHVLGLINLRGELVAVLNLRVILGLPAPTSIIGAASKKVIVVTWEEAVAGIAVHEFCEIIELHSAEISAPPALGQGGNEGWLKGTAVYKGRPVAILNLREILSCSDLIVHDML